MWHIAFILPEGHMLEHRGFHTRPLTSEELDAEFDIYGERHPCVVCKETGKEWVSL